MTLDRDLARLGRKLRRVSNVELPRANARALNDSGARTRTRSVRGISRETKLKSKTIRKRYFMRRATSKKQRVRLSVYTRPVSAVSQFTPSRLASIADGKGTSRKGVRVAGRTERSAFIATGPNRSRQVFRRTTNKRLPLEAIKYNIQEPATRITKRVVRRVMRTQYPKILQRELKFRLNKVANANT